MNFFGQQAEARRQTRRLIFIFSLAVIGMVVTVNGIAALLWALLYADPGAIGPVYPRFFFLTNSMVTLGLVLGGMLIETSRLQEGGDVVARMAGGRLLASVSHDSLERRLLNVVEEMALASGIACPKVYIMEREDGINAFAAGYRHDEAVIAVTRGALHRLDRDELQGVVAHEFSHILNGDMRLNLHLIAVLYGMQMVSGFGRTMIWNNSTNERRGFMNLPVGLFFFLFGIALYTIGYIGVVFGRIIKAAVSHQREYLADASAVQFTRSRDGIGGALRKIGGLARAGGDGSLIRHPNSEHLSHLFLAEAVKPMFGQLLPTHPPLIERLRRLYGKRVHFIDAPEINQPAGASLPRLPDIPFTPSSAFTTQDNAGDTGMTGQELAGTLAAGTLFPFRLIEAARSPTAAGAVVCALMMDPRQLAAQSAILAECLAQHAALAPSLVRLLATLPRHARMPLLDLAGPALQSLSQADRDRLLVAVNALVLADQRVTLSEFVLQIVLARRLAPDATRLTPIRYLHLSERKTDVALLLSLVSHIVSEHRADAAGREEAAQRAFNRGAGAITDVGLSLSDLAAPAAIDTASLQTALTHLDHLAPLAKPALIKALMAADNEGTLSSELADVICAICAGIDMPRPPAINAAYPETPFPAIASGWAA